MTYEVSAVRYGTLRSRKRDLFLQWDEYGEPDTPQSIDYYFYVLRSGSTIALVDTGFSFESALRRRRDVFIPPREAPEALGFAREDVTHLLISHLHWDHIGNLDAYPSAQILAPRDEVEFWGSDIASRPQFEAHVEPKHVHALLQRTEAGDVDLFEGDADVLPGVQAIRVGGHSPGQTMFLVETEGRPVLLASDAVHLDEELTLERPFRVVANLAEMYDAYLRIRELESAAGAITVAGHEPNLVQRFPAIPGAPAGTALRLSDT